jgi:lipopolysaccharide biosynthesis protein
LERPFEEVLKSGRPDFPFCLCWANENWTRRWDGLEQEVLLAQQYSPEDDRNFIISLFPAFNDERYVRVIGKPLLLVYRAGRLPNPAQTVELWRSECRRAGLGELYLCALDYFTDDLWAYGFDSAVEFPPHGLAGENLLPQVSKSNPNYHGVIVDYVQTAQTMIERPVTENVLFRGVMPGWDNTARRQDDSLIFLNSSPQAYEAWLRKAIELTLTRYRGDERIVFINAWNEWAEGAHLEPDCRYGLQYLEATRNALTVDTRLAKLVQR